MKQKQSESMKGKFCPFKPMDLTTKDNSFILIGREGIIWISVTAIN